MKKILFVLSLTTLVLGCSGGGSGSGTNQPGSKDGFQDSDFAGPVGNFDGQWSGKCAITIEGRTNTNCTSTISILQSNGSINVYLGYVVDHVANGYSVPNLSIKGNDIYNGSERIGQIGAKAFKLKNSKESILMKLNGPKALSFEAKILTLNSLEKTVDLVGNVDRQQ